MSAVAHATGQVLYFGKVPSRGDFVRSSAGSALIHSLDQWLSQTMALMAQDTRWKLVYDAAEPVHFAVLGARSHAGLVGHLSASQDASGRRFPFVTALSFEVPDPISFLPYSPQALAPLWAQLNRIVGQALHCDDFAQVQESLQTQPPHTAVRFEGLCDTYQAFARATTLEQLEAALSPLGHRLSCRQMLLALGMLLQPVVSQGHEGLNKGVMLPLTHDGVLLPHVLTLWVHLTTRFFQRTSAELVLLVTVQRDRPLLVMGFHGASPATLRTALDAEVGRAENVDIADAGWVEDWIGNDYGLRKLSNHLRDPELSIAAAVDLFRETFLGD